MTNSGVSERDYLVAIDDPFRQRLHGGFFGALEIRMVLVDAAARHAGSAHLDLHATGDERLQHQRKVLVIAFRWTTGTQRTKTFDRKVDAERFLTTVESAKLTGSYIDPAASRLTVGMWAQRWLEGQTHLKPSTRERYAGILRQHIDPRWGTRKLADVSHSAVQTWVSQVAASRSAATTRKVHRVLSLILAMAVKDDRLVMA